VLPEVAGVAAKLDATPPELIVDAVFPPGAASTDLFIYAGDAFVPAAKPLGPIDGGKQRFAITFATPSEAAAIKGKSLALTLVSDQGSTETTWTAE
jgi:DsbC/DsbD-like thiol-disulfide interchange protein